MVDFMGSINEGMNAAKQAEANKAEVKEVFAELNRQLSEVTDGKVTLDRAKFYKEDPSGYANITASLLGRARENYLGLGIGHTNENYNLPKIEIAKWDMDKKGYPCTIKIGSDELYCEDRNALENALSNLMRDPDVGTAIFKYMNYKPKD